MTLVYRFFSYYRRYQGTSKEKSYQRLGLLVLIKKLCSFYIICVNRQPLYLFIIIPTRPSLRATNMIKISSLSLDRFFKDNFHSASSVCTFKKLTLNFVRPTANNILNWNNTKLIKLSYTTLSWPRSFERRLSLSKAFNIV